MSPSVAPRVAPAVRPSPGTAVDFDGQRLHDAMRSVWKDYVMWTRLFLVSALEGLPQTAATAQRLLLSGAHIGDGMKPFYGDEVGARFSTLLGAQFKALARLVGAVKANDSAKACAANREAMLDATDVATFLTNLSPLAWPPDAAKVMTCSLAAATVQELTERRDNPWDGDVTAHARIDGEAMKMADMLSDGLRRQFVVTRD